MLFRSWTPAEGAPRARASAAPEEAGHREAAPLELVLMSASDEASLRALAGRTAEAILADPGITVAGVARAWAGRMPCPARLAVPARSREELVSRLAAVGRGERPRHVLLGTAEGGPALAFMYPGQGSQRTGMLHDLRQRFPVIDRSWTAWRRRWSRTCRCPCTSCSTRSCALSR